MSGLANSCQPSFNLSANFAEDFGCGLRPDFQGFQLDRERNEFFKGFDHGSCNVKYSA